jgi:hypothetical protein
MFQFPGLPPRVLWIQTRVARHYSSGVAPFGYPRIGAYNGFPWLFAGYCVLHRLLAPRYPPCALCSLTNVWNDINSSFVAGHHKVYPDKIIGGIRTSNMQFSGYDAGLIASGARSGFDPGTFHLTRVLSSRATSIFRALLALDLNSGGFQEFG